MSDTACMLDTPRELECGRTPRARVRAPRGDETYVAAPPLSEAIELARKNRAALACSNLTLQGRTLAELREMSRRELCRAARSYLSTLLPAGASTPGAGDDGCGDSSRLLFVSGHQPTLFHPGVWVKNFVVGRLAQRTGGVGLNLVVDNDTLSSTAARVPAGNREAPRLVTVPFDDPRPTQPWEEARVLNADLFSTFPDRVRQVWGDWGFEPLLFDFWPTAVEAARRGMGLADCLTAARRVWEAGWGAENLELPLSRLCTLEPFLWFASHVIARLPQFHRVYNEVLREYRREHHVRSRSHPVPDLREASGWLEAPFWVWRRGDTIRRRVFARQFDREIHLSDGSEPFAVLPLAPDRDACCAVEELRRLPERQIRFRTRALTTTLFARLCFADLFVHGIGGAIYDELADRIVSRFFGLCAPGFLTLSATLHLPVAPHASQAVDELRLRQMIRELDYHSERHLDPGRAREQAALIEEKRRLVSEQHAARDNRLRGVVDSDAPSQPGYERFRRLQEVNRRLAELTVPERRRLEEELARTGRQLAANAILQDRELAFCLHPADKLRHFMEHVCGSLGP